MTRRRLLPSVATAVALVLTLAAGACSSSGGTASSTASGASDSTASAGGPPASVAPGAADKPVAVVNGVIVTEASFNDELNAIGSVPTFLDATDLVIAPVATRLPGGRFDPAYVRSLLRRRVLIALVEHELATSGVAVNDTCRAAAVASLPRALVGAAGDTAEGQAFLDAFPKAYVDELTTWSAEVKQLQSQLSGLPCDTTDPSAQDRIGTAYATWLDASMPTAQIAVDPSFGTWDPDTGDITPPTLTTTTTVAPVPSSSGG